VQKKRRAKTKRETESSQKTKFPAFNFLLLTFPVILFSLKKVFTQQKHSSNVIVFRNFAMPQKALQGKISTNQIKNFFIYTCCRSEAEVRL